MSISKVEIKNILSFDDFTIMELSDINCIIGKNNVGKSNFLKAIRFFYAKLNNENVIPPELHSNYSPSGKISITYDTSHIEKIVKSTSTPFFKHIYNTLFKKKDNEISKSIFSSGTDLDFFPSKIKSEVTLTLIIKSDGSVMWAKSNQKLKDVISVLYPFFDIQARTIDLYNWDKLWSLISKLKSLNIKQLDRSDIITFYQEKTGDAGGKFSEIINELDKLVDTHDYTYNERLLNIIKTCVKGERFSLNGEQLTQQSDGTNSYQFIQAFLSLTVSLSRNDYITPIVFIDEPEIGLHPKLNEKLIFELSTVINEKKYSRPVPKIFLATHSPNILKQVIKLFTQQHKVLYFSKKSATHVSLMDSIYTDKNFISIFSDNEARLFFSNFILFVEGETEVELFGNHMLLNLFPSLREVDIYSANEKFIKNLNPTKSRLSIPYLIVYDADKVIDINFKAKMAIITKKTINIAELYNDFCYSFFSSDRYKTKKKIEFIMQLEKQKLELDSDFIEFTGKNISGYLSALNSVLQETKNVHLLSTTVEGVLINHQTLEIFEMWLFEGILEQYPEKKIGSTQLKIIFKKFYVNSPIQLAKQVLGHDEKNSIATSLIDTMMIKKIKKRMASHAIFEINRKFPNENTKLNIYRLIFNGKTDSLMSLENKAYPNQVPKATREMVNIITDDMLFFTKEMRGNKTSGWVTDFLNYTINTINEKYPITKNRQDEFNRLFPETRYIIDTASASIERGRKVGVIAP